MIKIRKATEKDLPEIARLAREIWLEHYPPIIGMKQVEYMLGKMYSLEALKDNMDEEVQFFIALNQDQICGFIAVELVDSEAFIHKLYVKSEERKNGIGTHLLDAASREFAGKAKSFILQVNRKNIQAINFYFRKQFRIRSVFDKEIGEGFIMEDFLMERNLKA